MSTSYLTQVRQALTNLNPNEVRETAERPIDIGLIAATPAGYAAIEEFLCPPTLSHAKRWDTVQVLHRASDGDAPGHVDLEIYEEGFAVPPGSFVFSLQNPLKLVHEILARRSELGLPLARLFPPFRQPVVNRIVKSVAKENALFSLATALPNIVPSIIELPWAVGEFASDTVFLTVNQIRMAFLIAAASDREVGYREQRAQIGSIIAGAFGWRALARELVGKIPLGGGLIPKAGIAYGGTFAVGASLERFYRIGYGFTREERKEAFEQAFERGKVVAGALLGRLRKPA